MKETDLAIYHNTLAKKVLFDGKRATGVRVSTSGLEYTLKANKEVIVSGGTFHSPQLLMVSGVGPREKLSGLGIDVVSDLPGVGQNLQDHVWFGPSYRVNVVTHSALHNATFRALAQEQYLSTQSGIATNGGGDIAGWEKLPHPQRGALSQDARNALAAFPNDWPELEYLMVNAYAGDSKNYIRDAPKDSNNYAAVLAALVAPLSRGKVTIASADTVDLPIVDPNWLGDRTDEELLVAGVRRVRELMDTPIMRSVTIGEEVYPGRNVSTDEQILEALREAAMTVWHAASTCMLSSCKALVTNCTNRR